MGRAKWMWMCALGALAIGSVAGAGCGDPANGNPDGGGAVDGGGVIDVDAGQGGDGGSGDGGAQADGGVTVGCDRTSQTQTADLALLDQLRSDVAKATTQQQKDALTQAFFDAIAEEGGTPLQSRDGGTRVAFVARDAPSSGEYSVGASFNNWQAGVDVLTRVGDSNVWALEKTLPRNQTYAYKMIDGSTWYEDRRARHVVWDGINKNAPGEFNELVYPEKQDATKGRLVAWRGVHSALFNDDRDVFVYVPAAYDRASCPVLPSMYFHDGNESLTRDPFSATADTVYAQTPADAAVLIFVALPSQDVRMSQYSFGTSTSTGDTYVDFLATELRPKIDAAFRVCPKPRDRGLAGASLGGLISGYGAFQKPETFGYVGSQSGSYFWNSDQLITMVQNAPKKALRWYVDTGCPDDNCDSNRLLRDALNAKGYELNYVEEPNGQHDWAYWQNRLPALLHWFRDGRTGCE